MTEAQETTIIRGISCGGTGGSLAHIDSKDGKIVRIRPMRWDEQYGEDYLKDRLWSFTARGKELKASMKTTPPHYALAYKKRVYSKNRVLYPLKRVDWEPGGDPEKINAQNRGKSKFKRISWDEAVEIVTSELNRVTEKYGANSILCVGEDGHKESKDIHSGGGWHANLMEALNDDFTREVRTPDSVEGWYWGAKHVWGSGCYMGLAMYSPSQNIIRDVSLNTDMIVLQSGDWEVVQNYASQFWTQIIRYWLDIGIEFVVIDPFCNYTSVAHEEMKWIPILPNTDAALDFAVMYVWLTEGTYDKDYIEKHVVGFDAVKDYILGVEDGVPKDPKWASERCGIPPWTIKGLARNWAAVTTSIGHYCGCHIRGPYSHEPARTEVYKLCMQGLGAPGKHQIHLQSWQTAWPKSNLGVDPVPPMLGQRAQQFVPKDQEIPRTMVMHAIKNEKIEWWGTPQIIYALADEQFEKHEYPIPEEEGGARVHLLWSEKPCNQACWNGGFEFQEAMRDPQVECFITNHQWIENDSLFADLILPVSTCLEEKDDVGCSQGDSVTSAATQDKAIEPRGESLSDFQIAVKMAEHYGFEEALTFGLTLEENLKVVFDNSSVKDEISWEEFSEKKYHIMKFREDWAELPSGQQEFYEDPEANPLDTPSGKIEFYSEALAEGFPEDKERQAIAKWIEGGPAEDGWTHDETLRGERAKTYPFLLTSNPGRWRLHVQGDDITWFREIETCKVRAADGYLYEPVWLSPEDAEAQGIADGDIVKVFNDRGTILGAAKVSQRVIPQSILINKGARVDPIAPGLDRGGSTNLICPSGPISKHCWGFVVTGYLVGIEKVGDAEMREWQEKYPDAFARDYDPAVGINYASWVEED